MNSLIYPASVAAASSLIGAVVTMCQKDISKINALVIVPLVMATATDAFMHLTEAFGYMGGGAATGAFLGCAYAAIAGANCPDRTSTIGKIFRNIMPLLVGTIIGFYVGAINHLAHSPNVDVYYNGYKINQG